MKPIHQRRGSSSFAEASTWIFPGAKRAPGAGVALAAGLDEVLLADLRGGVGGGQDVVGAVAARAVRDVDRAALHREAVEALVERLEAVALDAVLLREAERAVAGRADLLGDVRRGDRGERVVGLQDAVLAVAGRAGRRLADALGERLPVGALREDLVDRRRGSARRSSRWRAGSTAAPGADRLRTVWAPWQSTQLAAFSLPARRARPWTLFSYCAMKPALGATRALTSGLSRWQWRQSFSWACFAVAAGAPSAAEARRVRWQVRQAGASFTFAAAAAPWADVVVEVHLGLVAGGADLVDGGAGHRRLRGRTPS